ncbi:Ig-like domain repeat protein [Mesobacillus subterraneus]|uniref:Ig-like domain repeat protein n=1 Tax=Mesobacillus subterraneus TaxID=285983 RepID=UPI00273FBCC5|nr:Ig-like domain-containing protein [Mesobacillus subterraneus]WLR55356.1 Ig-like domain repeat protein [Mesobacillus subterraneus]
MLEPRKKKKHPSNKWAAIIPILLVLIVSVVLFNGKALSTLTNVDKKIGFESQEWNMAESFNKDWQTNHNPVTFTVDLRNDFSKANLQGQNVQAPFNITADQNGNPILVTDISPVGGAEFAGIYRVNIPSANDGKINIDVNFLNDEIWSLEAETKTFSITRDTTAPTVKLSGAENDILTNQDVKINVEVIEEHFVAENVDVTVSKNGNPYNVGDWGSAKSKSYSFSEEGEYIFTVKATDKVGNESSQEQLNFAIRKKAPELTVYAGEKPLSKGEVSKTDSVNLKISSKIKIDTATVTVLKDGEQIETKTFPAGDWETILNYPTPGEGEYEFQVKVSEKHARGEEHSLPSFAFTADKTAPKLAILDVENGGLYETDKNVKVTVDEVHMGNAHFEIKKKDINGEETSKSVDVKDGKASYTSNGEGEYTVTLKATDAAGNQAAEESVTFKVDKDGPILSISEDVDGKYFKIDKELTFSVKDISLVKANLNVKKDGDPYTIGNFIEKLFTSSVTHNFTEEGTYEVDLNSKDGKEREKSHPPVTFSIDKNDPVITASAVEKVKDEKKYYEVTVDVTDKYIEWENTSIKVYRNGELLSEIKEKEVAKTHLVEEDGEYAFEITATDKAGRVTSKNDVTFTIDNTDPQLSINGVEHGGYYQKLENLELAIEDLTFVLGETKLEVLKDGESYDFGKGDWDILTKGGLKRAVKKLSFDKDGDYEIKLTTKDFFGNENTLEPIKFTIDTIPPDLKIENVSEGDELGKDLNVKVSVTDKNMDLDKTFLNVTRNGEEYLAEKGQKVSGVHPFTEDGIYVINLESTDKAGNKNSQQQLTFTVDKSKPTLDITGFEAGEHYQKLEGVELSVEDLTIDLKATKIEVLRDGKPYEIENGEWNDASKGVLKRASRKLNFEEDGDYEIKLTSMDRVKHQHSFGPVKFTIDHTNPVIELSGIDEGDFVQKGKSVKVKVTEHNFNDNKVTIEATKNGMPYDLSQWENSGEVSELSHTFNEDGDYEITVNATDRAKNKAEIKTLSFTVDNIKPKISITGAKNNAYYNSDQEIKIAVDEHNFANNKVNLKVTRKIEVDGKSVDFPIGEWKNVKQLSDLSYKFDRDGEYQMTVEAKDAAGNAADTQTLVFTLDYIDPELSITGVSDEEHYRTDKPVSMKISDRNIDLSQTNLKVVRNGQPFKIGNPDLKGKTAAEKNFNFSQEGSYVIDLNTTDKAGNSKKHDRVTFIIDKTNPGVKIDGVENNSFNPENKNVTISIDELNYETNDVSISATKDGAAFPIGSWKNTSKLSKLGYNFNRDGLYTIQATAEDKAGNGPIYEKKDLYDR